MFIIKYSTTYVLAVLCEECATYGLKQICLRVFGEETEGKTILGSLTVEGRHIKMDGLMV
jgi:hypothetical protein